jgi:hypothetical protein
MAALGEELAGDQRVLLRSAEDQSSYDVHDLHKLMIDN